MPINPTGVSANIFSQVTSNIQNASERIGSGKRINSAADDAAGLTISNRLNSQINEFSQSIRNANDGISLLQTAEGGLSSITENLQRLRELSLQAANGTLNDSDREFINKEAQQLKNEIVSTVENTSFNSKSLFSSGENIGVQVGENNSIDVGIDNYGDLLESLDFEDLDLSTSAGANSALSTIDSFQAEVDSSSSDIGAQVNRLDSTINNLFSLEESATASRSRIEDADMAKEIANLFANNARKDISITLQAQANDNAGNVLRLLGL